MSGYLGTKAVLLSTTTATVGGDSTVGGDLTVDTNTLYVDSTNNRVGVGTVSPDESLHIFKATYPIFKVESTSYNGTLGIDTANGNFVLNNVSSAGLVFNTNNTERMRIDSSGNVQITQSAGSYTIDTTGGATVIANGGTVNFPNASGMLLVNNHSSGAVTLWLCGGGNTTAVASVGGTTGTFAYSSGIGGYVWTNNYGSAATLGFQFFRTRPTA